MIFMEIFQHNFTLEQPYVIYEEKNNTINIIEQGNIRLDEVTEDTKKIFGKYQITYCEIPEMFKTTNLFRELKDSVVFVSKKVRK